MAVNVTNFCYNQIPYIANTTLKITASGLCGVASAVSTFIVCGVMNGITEKYTGNLIVPGASLTMIGATGWTYVVYGSIEALGVFLGAYVTTGVYFLAAGLYKGA